MENLVGGCNWWTWSVIRQYFCSYFLSIFNPTSLPFLTHLSPLCLSLLLSSDTIFAPIFHPFLTQIHSMFLTPPFSLMLILVMFFLYAFTLMNKWQEHIRLVLLVTKQPVYWATNIPKQSCCSSSSPGSCAGTSSATTECFHHSKFRTSWTWSMSRSVSTTWRLLVIDRFLTTTAARSVLGSCAATE